MDINVVLFLSYACVNIMWDEFYACLKLCNPGNVCVCVKCDVWSLKEAGIVCNK